MNLVNFAAQFRDLGLILLSTQRSKPAECQIAQVNAWRDPDPHRGGSAKGEVAGFFCASLWHTGKAHTRDHAQASQL